jgi:DNA-binding GntR family transcriptional regulator
MIVSPKSATPAATISEAPVSRARPETLLERLRHEILRGGMAPGLLVTAQPNRGFIVSQLSPQEAEEILELRAVLECEAVRVAMRNMTDDDIAGAARILDQAEATDALDRWSDLNWEFHAALYGPAKRKRLLDMIRQVSYPTDRYIRVLIANANYRGRAEREHRAILSACEMRNADAAAALLNQHIRETGVLLAAFLNGQQGNG